MNSLELIKLSISEQYAAAIKMLEDTITECPDDLWQKTDGEKIISSIVYHVLFWLDRYLSKTRAEEFAFKPHLEDKDKTDKKHIYAKQELLDYAKFDRQKADTLFNNLKMDDLITDSVYDFHGSTFLSSLMYNLRHIMLHVGALHVRLSQCGIGSMEWESHNILFKTE